MIARLEEPSGLPDAVIAKGRKGGTFQMRFLPNSLFEEVRVCKELNPLKTTPIPNRNGSYMAEKSGFVCHKIGVHNAIKVCESQFFI